MAAERDKLRRMNDAISLLYVQGVLTEAEKSRARKRLAKRVQEWKDATRDDDAV